MRGNLSQDYSYDRLGNFDTATKSGVTWDYSYQKVDSLPHKPLRLTTVSGLNFSAAPTTGYDGRGNLTEYVQGNVTTTLVYDVEGRLTSVTTRQGTQADKTTTFDYDADGNRVRVLYPDDGGDIYTPFPDVEKAIVGGVTTWRITFSAGGQLVAQRRQVVNGATELFSLHTDHLGSVVAVGNASSGLVAGSYAAYEPFGTYLVPPTATNPSLTDRGFTGHKHNNLSPVWLGLIYMNARYYHPQLGRFISPDSIVPEPANPQSYNRYSYVRNSPLNFTDPSGHKECGSQSDCGDPLTTSPLQRLIESAGLNPKIYSFWIDPELTDAVQYYGNTEFAFNLSQKAVAGQTIPNYSYSQGFHGGLDLIANEGTVVYAGVFGIVEYVDGGAYRPSYIKIRIAPHRYLIIGHLAADSSGFKPGQVVTPKTVIGTVGNDHTHVEIWNIVDGQRTIESPYENMTPQVLKQLASLVADMNVRDSRINFHSRSDGRWQTYRDQPSLLYGSNNANLNEGQSGYVNPWD